VTEVREVTPHGNDPLGPPALRVLADMRVAITGQYLRNVADLMEQQRTNLYAYERAIGSLSRAVGNPAVEFSGDRSLQEVVAEFVIERLEETTRERDEWREQAQRDSALAVANERLTTTLARFGALQPPAEETAAIFHTLLRLDPKADMRAVPNQWLLNERGVSAVFKDNIDTLERKLRDLEHGHAQLAADSAAGFAHMRVPMEGAIAQRDAVLQRLAMARNFCEQRLARGVDPSIHELCGNLLRLLIGKVEPCSGFVGPFADEAGDPRDRCVLCGVPFEAHPPAPKLIADGRVVTLSAGIDALCRDDVP
jgi:hypothetical protein